MNSTTAWSEHALYLNLNHRRHSIEKLPLSKQLTVKRWYGASEVLDVFILEAPIPARFDIGQSVFRKLERWAGKL